MTPGPRTVDCTRHPGEEAGWICTQCRYALCQRCVAGTMLGGGMLMRCAHCGGEVRALVPPIVEPFWRRLPSFLSSMFTLRGVAALMGVSLLMALATLVPVAGVPLALLIAAVYYQMTMIAAIRGEEQLPLPGHPGDLLADALFGGMRLLIGAAWWLLALVAVAHQRHGLVEVALDPVRLLHDPWFVALVLVGLPYVPGLLVQVVVCESALPLLTPFALLWRLRSIPGSYLVSVAAWSLALALDVGLLAWLWPHLTNIYVPAVIPMLVALLALPLALVSAFVLGRFVLRHGSVFGVVPGGRALLERPDAI